MMIIIYSIVFNVITDSIISKIAMFVNLIDKLLEICKGICLNIIYEFVKIVYFLIDVFKVVIALAVATITFIELLL